jgi:hypothetical protein
VLSAQDRIHSTRKVKGLSRIHAYFYFKSQWRNLSRSPSFSFRARMPVLKMVKMVLIPFCTPLQVLERQILQEHDEKMPRRKSPPNRKRRIETILNQFRNSMHARHGHGKESEWTVEKAWVAPHIYLVHVEILWILKKQNVIRTPRPVINSVKRK